MRRLTAFVRAVLVLASVSIVAPAALALASERRFGGRLPFHGVPAPSAWDVDRIERALTSRLDEQTVVDVVIRLSLVVAWAALAMFLLTVIAEVVHMVRHGGHHLPDVRGIAWSQRGARTVAAGLLALLPMVPVRDPAIAAGAGDGAVLRAWSTAARPAALVEMAPAVGVEPAAMPAAPVAPSDDYVVRAGDSVYGIARRIVGPHPAAIAAYADRIVEANLGREMASGERFTNPGYIDVGWVLTLPSAQIADVGQARDVARHTVAVGESLWSIADDELGDGTLWPELYRANEGRVFDDGRVLGDPAVLRPGWTLDIPQPEPVTASVESEAPTRPEPSIEAPVAPTPTTSRPAAAVDHDAHHDDALVAAPPIAVAGETVGAVGAGDHPAAQSKRRPVNEWTARDTMSAGVVGQATERPADDTAGGEPVDESAPQLVTVRRATMLAGGVLTLLAVRRRRRLREARPRVRLPEPHPRVRATERTLRIAGAGARLARVDIATRAVTPALLAGGQRVLAVLCSPDGELELVATGPVTLPSVWRGSGERWALPARVPIEMLASDARQVAAPCPALVQLGVDARDRDVYVDLEAISALEVGGEPVHADAIVAAVAATLAGSVLAETTTLLSVGLPAECLLGHRLHRVVPDVEAAYELARVAVGASTPADRSRFELRARGTSGESWEPAVVLVASGADPVPPPGSGIALVSASPINGPSSVLAPDGDAWVLRPAGLRIRPVGLAPEDVVLIAELVDLDHVVDADGVDDDRTIYTSEISIDEDVGALHCTDSASVGDLEWDVLVRLFGTVELVDRRGERTGFERSKPAELVAWLATHREAATRSGARTALWEHAVRDETFANVVSEARVTIARTASPPAGTEWIGRTLTDELPLHSRVRTDADLIAEALAVSHLQSPVEAIETLRGPVEALAGPPFEGSTYLWPDAEGLTSNLVLLATTAAAELAEHCLSVGDVDGVLRATDRGLAVLPGHATLVALRMRAHAETGDHAGVRREWNGYRRVVNTDPWSDGEPSSGLVELRKQLVEPSA